MYGKEINIQNNRLFDPEDILYNATKRDSKVHNLKIVTNKNGILYSN